MNDTVINLNNSILQHGKFNDRIYLMKLSNDDFPGIIDELDELAAGKGYSKIIAKVPGFARDRFKESGYDVEAFIPKFFRGDEDVHFMGKYLSDSRKLCDRWEEIQKVLDAAISRSCEPLNFILPPEFDLKICDKSDASQIANAYNTVFETYPFPINDPEYIMKTMDENFLYFSARENNNIAALSSSEMDISTRNVEMTDFATLPKYRGNGLAIHLLHNMEDQMKNKNMKIAYTIARAGSYAINITFSRMGYDYGGTLINNTNISGSFESMNVWYKFL